MMNISFIHCTRFPPEQKQQMFPVIIKLNTLYVIAVPKKNKMCLVVDLGCGWRSCLLSGHSNKNKFKHYLLAVNMFLLNPSVE